MIKKVNVLNDTHQLLQPEYLSHMTAENLQEAYRACSCHSRFYFGMEQLSSLPLDIKTQSTVLLIILVNTIRFNPVSKSGIRVQFSEKPLDSTAFQMIFDEIRVGSYCFSPQSTFCILIIFQSSQTRGNHIPRR